MYRRNSGKCLEIYRKFGKVLDIEVEIQIPNYKSTFIPSGLYIFANIYAFLCFHIYMGFRKLFPNCITEE
jgi:hypothetical protein